MSNEQMEQEIIDKGLTSAPRITLNHVKAMMERVTFQYTCPEGTTTTLAHAFLDGKFYLVTGFAACIDPANYDKEQGTKYAIEDTYDKALDKLYELEGYRLYRETQIQSQDL